MNFCNFPLKSGKRRSKVIDDRPFNFIVDDGKEKLIKTDKNDAAEKPLKWVNCATAKSDSEDSDINISNEFRSFNHYFDEPIYSEPIFKTNKTSESLLPGCDSEVDYDPKTSTFYDFLRMTEGRYHCKTSSTDSDYESFSVDKTDLENSPCQGRNQIVSKWVKNVDVIKSFAN